MSATIQVYLRSSNVPTVAAWNAAIKAHGFDLVLDTFDLHTDTGYRPAMLKDRESGFEWFLLTAAQTNQGGEFPTDDEVGDCDMLADLSYSTYADEDVACIIAASVLAALTDGYYRNTEEENEMVKADTALAAARKAVLAWERRGPWQPEEESASQPPPAKAPVVPPVISSRPIPPVPAIALPTAVDPQGLRYYRMSCGLFVLMYIAIILYSFLITRGIIEPTLGPLNIVLTANDPVARAEALAEERKKAVNGYEGGMVGALFYAFAAFVPRKPWGWKVGRVAIIGMFFPFLITVALTIPLLKFWKQPQTKFFFGQQI